MSRYDLFSRPLLDFLRVTLEETRWERDPGHWKSPMFEFTRWIKGHSRLGDLSGFDAAGVVEPVLIQLMAEDGNHAVSESVDAWAYHFEGSDDPRAEFIDTWDKVKIPANMDALGLAWREAERLPLKPQKRYSEKYCLLISLAGHLQRSRPRDPIALPLVRIGKLLGCDRKCISGYLRFAVKERILQKSADHIPHRRATEFRFDTNRFNWETGAEVTNPESIG